MKPNKNKGFTSIEIMIMLLMVIAIMVTYLALLGPIDFSSCV